jgi:hypothetical protein
MMKINVYFMFSCISAISCGKHWIDLYVWYWTFVVGQLLLVGFNKVAPFRSVAYPAYSCLEELSNAVGTSL